jgi:hypothetical protein
VLSGELQPRLAALGEGFGSAYERYAVNRLLEALARARAIRTVAEWPANGVLGVPGLKSLVLGRAGCEVTLLHPSPRFLADVDRLWRAAKQPTPAHLVARPDDDRSTPEARFDLVWSFCALEHTEDPAATLRAMLRASSGVVLVFVQNVWGPGMHAHRLGHWIDGKRWDHGAYGVMSAGALERLVARAGGRTLEVGGCDLPPWPDINVRIPRPFSRAPLAAPRERIYGPGDPVMTQEAVESAFARAPELRTVDRWLMAWHDRVEARIPRGLLRWIAHHPYVIAERASR